MGVYNPRGRGGGRGNNRRNNRRPQNNGIDWNQKATEFAVDTGKNVMNYNMQNNLSPFYHHVNQSMQKKASGIVIGLFTAIPKALFKVLNTLLVRTFNINRKKAGKYLTQGANIIKFPLLATESIDQSLVNKFCALLQSEKAENIRTFFHNHDLTLGYANHNVAKEFDPGFYKEHFENNGEGEMLSELVMNKEKITKKVMTDTPVHKNPFDGKALKLPSKDLMPIAPVMITIATNAFLSDDYNEQILGVRYIPHRIPFNEIKVAFKYGALNNRFLLRLIKLMQGDLTFGDWLTNKDKKALNFVMTKIAVGDKSWSKALKDSTHAVTMIMSKEEFDHIKENIVDLSKPINFKNFQKDIGMLDLIIVDRNSQEFIRINSSDNYTPVKHDMREALNAYSKDIVINTKIEASNFHDEDVI